MACLWRAAILRKGEHAMAKVTQEARYTIELSSEEAMLVMAMLSWANHHDDCWGKEDHKKCDEIMQELNKFLHIW